MKKVGIIALSIGVLLIISFISLYNRQEIDQQRAEEIADRSFKNVGGFYIQNHSSIAQNDRSDFYEKRTSFDDDHWLITYTSKADTSPYEITIAVNSTNGEVESIEEEERIIVLFKDDVQEELIQEASGEILNSVDTIPVVTAQVPVENIEELKKDPAILTVEKDTIVTINAQKIDWGTQKIRAPIAWNSNFTGKGQKIAVIDSGITMNHQDLAIVNGVSFLTTSTSYNDENGHGTQVAGIIGAKYNDFGVVGVAPNADIYAVKVLDQSGAGYLSDIIAGIDWAIQNKMDIINLSLGSQTPSSALKMVVDKAYANGILVVASAGNTGYGSTGNTIHYPAAYDSVIAVGATNEANQWADFSSVGPNLEVIAPGDEILTTYLNNTFVKSSGTSMSAPFVSGLLALFKEQYPDLSAKNLRAIIQKNVIDLGNPGRDPYYGYGLVQYSERLKNIKRISGANRFQVSVNLSKTGWPEQANTVVLANYIAFADALSSAPLAFKENAPILLTHKDYLTKETSEEIKRLRPNKVIIIGGKGSVSEKVIADLHSIGISGIERIEGRDRFEVSYQIAQKMGATDTAIIADGLNFPDALAIAPYAAKNGYPIFLANKNKLPEVIQKGIKEKNIQHTIVVGGDASVGHQVFLMLPHPIRISGKDRFEVSTNILNELTPSPNGFYFATGYSFADAMTGSVLAAKENAAILLTQPKLLPQPVQNTVKLKNVTEYKILGGTGSVSEDVYMKLMFDL